MSTNTLESESIKFLDYTHRLNDYNEISNMNDYMLKTNTIEEKKLRTYNDVLRTKVMKMKQEYLLREHEIQQYHFRTRILYISIIFSSIALLLAAAFIQGNITKKVFFIISLCIGIVYLTIVLIMINLSKNRRKYAWDQYYWDPIKKN